MVGALALLLAAQVPVPPLQVQHLHCRAVAVNGAAVDFPFEMAGAGENRQARVAIGNAPFAAMVDNRFPIDDLPNAMIFDVSSFGGLGGMFEIELYLRQDDLAGFPIATGFCSERPFVTPPAATTTFAALNDAMLVAAADAHLPCHLLTLGGEVSRFRTRLVGGNRLFDPLDSIVWASPRSSPEMAAPPMPPRGANLIRVAAIFAGGDESENPTGFSLGTIDQERALAVGTISFTGLGSGHVPEQKYAMAICPFRMQRGQ